jgi:hypothetical protein
MLAVLAMVFAPLSNVVSLFGVEGLPFSLNIGTFGLIFTGLVFLYVLVYWLILNWQATVKPLAGACGKRVSPVFDLVTVLSRLQEALQAAARVLAGGNANIVSELPGSLPTGLPGPVQSPCATSDPQHPQRVGPWSKWSKRIQRHQPAELELSVAV